MESITQIIRYVSRFFLAWTFWKMKTEKILWLEDFGHTVSQSRYGMDMDLRTN